MGFIALSSGITDFSKAVISLWFRIPQASLDAARAQFDTATGVFPDTDFRLAGVIPLVTFGPNAETYTIFDAGPVLGQTSSGPISPCVIGVACGDSGDGTYRNTMYARLQYASGAPAPAPFKTVYNDFFQIGAKLAPSQTFSSIDTGSFIEITAGAWHHVLISFDLSGGCSSSYSDPNLSIDSTCPFFWAVDDVNYNSNYLWPNTPVAIGGTDVPNGIFSDRCIQNTGSFSFAAGNLPASGNGIGLPSISSNSSKIYLVEMARLAFFTGVTTDTSVEDNRRAFVTSDGRPADPALARTLLDTAPILEFKTNTNFIAGHNTGTGDEFVPTGSITDFSPGP